MALRLSGLHVFIQFVILMSETKNELETLLEQAATEPAHRPAFFRTLLESTVWVPGTAAEGEAVVEDSALDLQHWEKEDGTTVIPFFTSLEALQQAVEDEQAFVVMPVRTLFEMTLNCRPAKSLCRVKSAC